MVASFFLHLSQSIQTTSFQMFYQVYFISYRLKRKRYGLKISRTFRLTISDLLQYIVYYYQYLLSRIMLENIKIILRGEVYYISVLSNLFHRSDYKKICNKSYDGSIENKKSDQ